MRAGYAGLLTGVLSFLASSALVFTFLYLQKHGFSPDFLSGSKESASGESSQGVISGLSGNENPIPVSSPSPNLSSPVPDSLLHSPSVDPSSIPSVAASAVPSVSPLAIVLPPELQVDGTGLSKATIAVETQAGVFKFKLYSADAPRTVVRFYELVGKGFYNGLKFHRVVAGFVVQGGDPLGTGQGGSGQKLVAEFNDRKHVEGAVAMARAPSDPNSADSQFYISLGAIPYLDHQYTVFGQVTEGIDVVRKVKLGDVMTRVVVE